MENADIGVGTARPGMASQTQLPALSPDTNAWEQVREVWGDSAWSPVLRTLRDSIEPGRDIAVMVPSDTSFLAPCYYLSAVLSNQPVVVVFPDSMRLQDELSALPTRIHSSTAVLASSLDHAEVALRLRDIASGRIRLIFVTPDRLRQAPLLRTLRMISARLWVIHDAHRFSLLSSDVHPDYLAVWARLNDLGNPPLLAVMPAVSSAVLNDICAATHRRLHVVQDEVLPQNVRLAVRLVAHDGEKEAALLSFLAAQAVGRSSQQASRQEADRQGHAENHQPGSHHSSGIIYTATPRECVGLTRLLIRKGFRATALHSEMSPTDHTAIQDAFTEGRSPIIVTTEALGHTLRRSDIRFVVHYQPTSSLEDYVLECGQAGRDGQPAGCLTFVSPDARTLAPQRIRAGRLHIEQLRSVYAALGAARRARLPSSTAQSRDLDASWRLVSKRVLVEAANAHLERVKRDSVRELDQDSARMALGILERVGLIRQHLDFPRAAVLSLRLTKEDQAQQQTEAWQRFLQVSGLERSPEGVTIDPVALCAELGWPPPLVEETLLTWHDEGVLTYRGVGRDMLIEMRGVPAGVHEALPALLADIDARDDHRLQFLYAFWETTHCRRTILARYFEIEDAVHVGPNSSAACGACDCCETVA